MAFAEARSQSSRRRCANTPTASATAPSSRSPSGSATGATRAIASVGGGTDSGRGNLPAAGSERWCRPCGPLGDGLPDRRIRLLRCSDDEVAGQNMC